VGGGGWGGGGWWGASQLSYIIKNGNGNFGRDERLRGGG